MLRSLVCLKWISECLSPSLPSSLPPSFLPSIPFSIPQLLRWSPSLCFMKHTSARMNIFECSVAPDGEKPPLFTVLWQYLILNVKITKIEKSNVELLWAHEVQIPLTPSWLLHLTHCSCTLAFLLFHHYCRYPTCSCSMVAPARFLWNVLACENIVPVFLSWVRFSLRGHFSKAVTVPSVIPVPSPNTYLSLPFVFSLHTRTWHIGRELLRKYYC